MVNKKKSKETTKNHDRNYIPNEKGLEIFTIDNFVKEEECDYLSTLIQKHSSRSMVADSNTNISKYHEGRTSSTSTLSDNDPIVQIINKRISEELNVPENYGESFQGQIYEVGQEFRHHTDWFSPDTYMNHCLHSGQRTWTFMFYLNEVDEGGYTDFPHINFTVKPKKGMAVVWKNSDGTGKENPASYHAGLPVLKGKKIIVTKWFREKPWDMTKDIKLAKEYWEKNKTTKTEEIKKQEEVIKKEQDVIIEKDYAGNIRTIKVIKSPQELPKITPTGFKVTKVPPKTWKLIQEVYSLLKNEKRKENWEGITNFIHDSNKKHIDIDFFDMDMIPRIKEIIQEELKGVHDSFIEYKEELEPVWIYGMRSYTNGSVLEHHTDRPTTHHISSIVIVDKKINEDWPLQIQDHTGKWHEIYTNPGDMILYESAICKHGRIKPLNGEYYRNFFVHYKYKNYTLL